MTPETPLHRAPRSAFTAGVLSLVFPGLGQAYAGRWLRALVWAAPPILLLALALGTAVRMDRFGLAGLALQAWFLNAIFIGNLALLLYRAASVVDAWLVVRARNAEWRAAEAAGTGAALGGSGAGSPLRRPARASSGLGLGTSLSLAGLFATLVVLAGAHVAVARYDLLASQLANCVFDANGTAQCGDQTGGPTQSPSDSQAGGTGGVPSASIGSPLPTTPGQPWTGTERLNILLVGIDQRGDQQTFNTDTLIVASVDPTTKRVAMFSIPRDTVNVPLPPGPLRNAFGTVYGSKINSLWAAVADRPDLCPGTTRIARGFNCLKSVIGYLYGLDVQYYVEVNFTGFTKVVDALGGVTIDVQSPVVDDHYPTDGQGDRRVYIPTGIQHMDGAEALIYARSRHGSNDFDRGARQQRVITSMLAQTDISKILPNVDQLAAAFEQTVRTDIPREILPQLLNLASQVDTKAIRSFVFAPPLYETEDYVPGVHDFLYPKVQLIRSTVKTAFTADPTFEAEREKVAQEGGTVWVLNGSGFAGRADDVAAYLDYQGFAATAPRQKAATIAAARIVVYNGAEARLTETIARLEAIFGVTVVTKNDPSIRVDVIVTIGRSTPDLLPPPGS